MEDATPRRIPVTRDGNVVGRITLDDCLVRMTGHSGECTLWGDGVDLDRAISDGQRVPKHRHCWADASGALDWFLEVG